VTSAMTLPLSHTRSCLCSLVRGVGKGHGEVRFYTQGKASDPQQPRDYQPTKGGRDLADCCAEFGHGARELGEKTGLQVDPAHRCPSVSGAARWRDGPAWAKTGVNGPSKQKFRPAPISSFLFFFFLSFSVFHFNLQVSN
jgi:hypothetical protein